jgi:CHAT domain-containing protein
MFKMFTRKISRFSTLLFSMCVWSFLFTTSAAKQVDASTLLSKPRLQQTCGRSGPLIAGQKHVCSIGADESHDYTIESVNEGEYVHIEVDQRGVDVVLTLIGPNEFKRERNWPSENRGFEYLSFEAPASGTYHLKITVDPNRKPEPGSDYSLILSERKRPSPADLSRAKAEELFDRGREKKELAERIELLGQAVTEWRKSGDAYGLATGLSSWGYAKGSTDEVFTKPLELLQIYEEALRIWETFNQTQRRVLLVLYIARIYDVNAQLNRSVDYYKQALTLYLKPETPKNAVLHAAILNNLGTAQHRLEDDEDAIESLKGAIEAVRGQRQDLEAIANNNLGQTYMEVGRLDEAEACFKLAQEIRKNKDFDPAGWATTRHNQGGLEEVRKNFDKAEGYLREALQLREKGPREFETLHLLAYVMNLNGKSKDALSLYQRVLPFVERRPELKAITLMNVGRIYDDQGESDKALRIYQQAVELLSLIDSPAIEWTILFALGRSERDHNLFELASEHLSKAYELTLRQSKRRINLNLRALYLADTRVVTETYVEVLMRLADKRNDSSLIQKALEISEQSRSRSLIEMLKEAKVSIYKDVDPKLLEQANELEKQLKAADYVRQERQFNQASSDLQKAAQTTVNQLTQQLESVDTRIRRANKRFADLLAPEPFAFNQLAQTLDENTVALEFLLGDKQSYAWLISSSGIIAAEPLPPRSEIEPMANKFHQILRDGDRNFADPGARLSEMLLKPFINKIRGKSLLIVPDGALYYVPFAALPVSNRAPSRTGRPVRYLVQEQPITILPSLSTLIVQRDTLVSRPPAAKALMVFADPVYDFNDPPHGCEDIAPKTSGVPSPKKNKEAVSSSVNVARGEATHVLKLPRIPQTQKEMLALLSLPFRGQKDGACGFDASARNASPTSLAPYRFIHFAVHSTINSEHPELSGLVLSLFDPDGKHVPEGVLRLNDIYRLNLQSDLVVLSACETIRGKDIRGEGIVGLTRGFMAAGAKRVVTSFWKVSDQPQTVELMKFFYQGLLNRRHPLPPPVALQEAQKQMLSRHPGLHPRYWAAFTIEGEYRTMPER